MGYADSRSRFLGRPTSSHKIILVILVPSILLGIAMLLYRALRWQEKETGVLRSPLPIVQHAGGTNLTALIIDAVVSGD